MVGSGADGVDCIDYRCGGIDHVDAQMRACTVGGKPLERRFHLVARSVVQRRAGLSEARLPRFRTQVNADEVIGVVDDALFDHFQRTHQGFLAGLKNEFEGSLARLATGRNACCAQHHRHVRIVPTGVERTLLTIDVVAQCIQVLN